MAPPYDMGAEEFEWKVEPLQQKLQLRKRNDKTGQKEFFVGLRITVAGKSWCIVKGWSEVLAVEERLRLHFTTNQIRVMLTHLPSVEAAASLAEAKVLGVCAAFFRDALCIPGTLPVFAEFFLTGVEEPQGTLTDGPQTAGFLEKKKGEGNLKRTKRFCAIKHRMLSYFKKQGDSNPTGVIALDGSICSLVEGGKGGFRIIQRDGSKYLFKPSSADEAKRWVECITAGNEIFKKLPRVVGELEICVVAARDLAGRNESGLSSPFAVVFCDLQQKRTGVALSTLNPVWGDGEVMRFTVFDLKEVVCVNLWSGSPENGAFLGMCLIPLSVIPSDKLVDRWFALAPRQSDEKVTGAVRLCMRLRCRAFDEDADDLVAGSKLYGLPLSNVLHSEGNTLPIPLAVGFIIALVKERLKECERERSSLFLLPDPTASGVYGKMVRDVDAMGSHSSLTDLTSVVAVLLRHLPEPLLSFGAFGALAPLCAVGDEGAVTQWLTMHLKAENKALMRYLCTLLRQVDSSSSLSLDLIADLFSPTLLRPPSQTDATVTAMLAQSCCVKYLLEHSRDIFGDANLDNLVLECRDLRDRGVRAVPEAAPAVATALALIVTAPSSLSSSASRPLPPQQQQAPASPQQTQHQPPQRQQPQLHPSPLVQQQPAQHDSPSIYVDVDKLHLAYASTIEPDSNLVVGCECHAQYTDDDMWYPAVITSVDPLVVTFANYGNQQVCRPDQVVLGDGADKKEDDNVEDELAEFLALGGDAAATNPAAPAVAVVERLPPPPSVPFAIGFMASPCRAVRTDGSALDLARGKMVAVLDEPRAGSYRVLVDSDVVLVPVSQLERMAMMAAPAPAPVVPAPVLAVPKHALPPTPVEEPATMRVPSHSLPPTPDEHNSPVPVARSMVQQQQQQQSSPPLLPQVAPPTLVHNAHPPPPTYSPAALPASPVPKAAHLHGVVAPVTSMPVAVSSPPAHPLPAGPAMSSTPPAHPLPPGPVLSGSGNLSPRVKAALEGSGGGAGGTVRIARDLPPPELAQASATVGFAKSPRKPLNDVAVEGVSPRRAPIPTLSFSETPPQVEAPKSPRIKATRSQEPISVPPAVSPVSRGAGAAVGAVTASPAEPAAVDPNVAAARSSPRPVRPLPGRDVSTNAPPETAAEDPYAAARTSPRPVHARPVPVKEAVAAQPDNGRTSPRPGRVDNSATVKAPTSPRMVPARKAAGAATGPTMARSAPLDDDRQPALSQDQLAIAQALSAALKKTPDAHQSQPAAAQAAVASPHQSMIAPQTVVLQPAVPQPVVPQPVVPQPRAAPRLIHGRGGGSSTSLASSNPELYSNATGDGDMDSPQLPAFNAPRPPGRKQPVASARPPPRPTGNVAASDEVDDVDKLAHLLNRTYGGAQ